MTTINKFLPVFLKGETISAPENKTKRRNEYELAQKASSGDIDAFERIYWAHQGRVFSVCLRMTKNFYEAEDVMQAVFIQLFKKIGSFRGDSAFSTWLHRLTVNQILMHFRSNKACKEQTTEDGELPENDFANSKKSGGANQYIDRFQLKEAIAKLPKGYRKVIILYEIHGFEHDEIAQILGCAAGTSKSQLHKARRKLRKLLAVGN